MIQQVMEAMHIPFLSCPGTRPTTSWRRSSTEAAARGLDVFLCTSDKDCRQLVTEKVKMLNLRKEGEILDAAGILADWGVRPDQVIDFQALVGDSVDNIPGVPGVGPKTAAKWLQQFGTLDNLIAHAEEAAGGPKTKQALKDAIANGDLAKSRQLVTLDTQRPDDLRLGGLAAHATGTASELLELFHEFGFRGVRRARPQDAGEQRREEERRGAGDRRDRACPSHEPERQRANRRPQGRRRKARRSAQEADRPEPLRPIDEATDEAAALQPLARPPRRPTAGATTGYELVDTAGEVRRVPAELKKQKRSSFDLETTGLDPIADPIVGYAFCWEKRPRITCPVRAPEEDATLDPDATLAALKPIFEDPAVAKREPQHQVRPDRAGGERRRTSRASPATR